MENVRLAVFDHSANHFKACNIDRPRVDNFNFKSVSVFGKGN